MSQRFNSMIVRLKVMIRPNGRGQFEGFNSMIVRLKDCTYRRCSRKGEKFQFYDSPIKRSREDMNADYGKWGFNSMIVRLKGSKQSGLHPQLTLFQFYDSPIKRSSKVSLHGGKRVSIL